MGNRMRRDMSAFQDSGVLLVDKPVEWTSHDVVGFIRSRFNVEKVGHCGTLDPNATGLLVIVLGRATKLSQRLAGDDKDYEGDMLLGVVTDSQDLCGKVLEEKDTSKVSEEEVRTVFGRFVGELLQTPPMVSAKKIGGKKLYELARQGKEIERESKPIVIHRLDITAVALPVVSFAVACSKGTYVRTICHDIGQELGCGASLKSLRRTRSGEFKLEDAVTVDAMREWTQEELSRKLSWIF